MYRIKIQSQKEEINHPLSVSWLNKTEIWYITLFANYFYGIIIINCCVKRKSIVLDETGATDKIVEGIFH